MEKYNVTFPLESWFLSVKVEAEDWDKAESLAIMKIMSEIWLCKDRIDVIRVVE